MTTRISTAAALAATLLLSLAPAATAQDWRGQGHIAGKITDDSGQPLEGAIVKAQRAESKGGPQAKTGKNGEWAINGIAKGQWHLDFEKPGYEPSKIDIAANEVERNPPVMTVLKKSAPDPNAVITAELNKAADLIKQQKYPEARAIYEGILAKYPQAYQVEPYIARTYYAEKQLDQAIEHLRKALEKDPANATTKLLLAQILAEKGNAEESRQLMASIDESKIADPSTLLNIGIGMLNQQKPDEAITWFDKTVTRFPQYAEGYYYRGITQLQLGKDDQAKVDLSKFVEMAPNAPEAATAKGILEKLK